MKTAVQSNGHDKRAAARLCKCGCGSTIPAGQRFGYALGHMKRPRLLPGAAAGAGAIPRPAPAVHSLQVTAVQLDRFLGKLYIDWPKLMLTLPPELKLALVNHYLATDAAVDGAGEARALQPEGEACGN